MTRTLNQADADRLEEADQNVTAQKLALALQLLEADGRLEQYEGSGWQELPPMFRWMVHAMLTNDDLRQRIITVLKTGDKWPTTNPN